MEDRLKQKDLFVYWKPGSQNMGDYFKKHHPPHYHKETRPAYLYMKNAILKIIHTVVQGWENDVLKINPTFVQGCVYVVCTYGHKNIPTVT